MATVDAADEHEYPIGAARPAADSLASEAYDVLHGAELDSVLRSGRALLECQVQQKATMVPGTMQARYPVALKAVNGAGSLIAQFVIDTNGRAELGTMTMWASPNTAPEFGASTRDGLSRARFHPAVSDGRKVRQLVQLPMTFELIGRGAPLPLPKTQGAPLGGGPPPLDPKRPAANR